jgi:hypothetical protein
MASFVETLCDRILENEIYYEIVEEPNKSLRDEDVEKISKALEKNDKINTVYLNDNVIGFKGLKHILDSASMNFNLEQIQFGWNSLEENSDANTDPKKVLAILKDTNVSLLDVSFTNFSEECINELIKILPFTLIRTLYINGNDVTEVQKIEIRKILLSNIKSYEEQYWIPWKHSYFSNRDSSLHEIVMTSILCNSTLSYRLPLHVWIYIFSFWQRKQFYIDYDDDDMSDGEIDDDDDDDDVMSDGDDGDDE